MAGVYRRAWRRRQPLRRAWVGTKITAGGATTPQTLAATCACASPTIVRSVGKLVTSTAVACSAPTLRKQVGKAITSTAVACASPVLRKSVGKVVTATAVACSSPVMRRSVGKIVAATTALVPAIVRSVAKTLTATTVACVPVMFATRAFLKTMAATVACATPTIVRSVGKNVSATVNSVAALVASFVSGAVGVVYNQALAATVNTLAQVLPGYLVRNLPNVFFRDRRWNRECEPENGSGTFYENMRPKRKARR